MEFLVYKVLSILVLLGAHLWLMASLEMSLVPPTPINSCSWFLLTCPWFALSKWPGSASHPPLCGNRLLSVLWDLPQLHPFSFYIFQSSQEPPNDDTFLWSENVSDGSPQMLIIVYVKVAVRKKTPTATGFRSSNRVKLQCKWRPKTYIQKALRARILKNLKETHERQGSYAVMSFTKHLWLFWQLSKDLWHLHAGSWKHPRII